MNCRAGFAPGLPIFFIRSIVARVTLLDNSPAESGGQAKIFKLLKPEQSICVRLTEDYHLESEQSRTQFWSITAGEVFRGVIRPKWGAFRFKGMG